LDLNKECGNGLRACLKHVHSLPDRPDMIIQGGDLIMDALVRDEASVKRQYDLAAQIFNRCCTIPVVHVIGNHDVWGWQNPSSASLQQDPRFGKGWWLGWTGYRSTYRSFDRNGWHFVMLDSIYPSRRGYAARLDDTQLSWLERDLEATPPTTPVCIVSHAPILSANAMFFGPSEKEGDWRVHRSLMHIDSRRLKDLFVRHPNVKTCISGHIHMAGRVDYNGVKHFGIGAVCGAWWRGKMQETPPQFGLVDFYDSGHVHVTLVDC
jgi:3',5'-cyclic AMP phosphodiesterase CpdA